MSRRDAMRRYHRPVLMVALVLLGIGLLLSPSAFAQVTRADCREAPEQPPGWGGKVYICTFTNYTGVPVNDIEITFIDRAQKVGPATDPIWHCTGAGGGPPPRAASTTIYCRDASGRRSIPAGETFTIHVRADNVPPLYWFWSIDGTLVPTPTLTSTPEPSND